jgi:hypothetical protein
MTALTAVAKGHQVGFAADTPALGFTALLTRFHVNCFMLIGKMRLKENVDCMLSLTFSLSLAAPPQSSFRNCFAEQCGELKTLAGSLFAIPAGTHRGILLRIPSFLVSSISTPARVDASSILPASLKVGANESNSWVSFILEFFASEIHLGIFNFL